MKKKTEKPVDDRDGDHLRVLTFHQRRFVVGLTWQTIREQRNPMREIRRVGKEKGLELVAVRQSDSIQAGFAPKTRMRLRGTYSLTVALASLLDGCCIAVVALGASPEGVEQYTLVGKTERGGIHPRSDKVYPADKMNQCIIDLRDELRGSKGDMDVPVHGDPAQPWVTVPLDLASLLIPGNLSKNFRLRPLTWGMTRRQLATAGLMFALGLAGLMYYFHIEDAREARARASLQVELARQAELNKQARYKAALEGLRHPWTERSSVGDFINRCQDVLNTMPISIRGWMSTGVLCSGKDVSVQSLRRTNSAATTADYVSAVQALFGVMPVFDFQNSSQTSFSLPQRITPEGDDPMVPVGERLMEFISLFQSLNIDLSVTPVAITDVKKNSEGEDLPLQDWQEYMFSAETDVPPRMIFTGSSYPGVRLSHITVAINTSDGSVRYKLSGSLYGKR